MAHAVTLIPGDGHSAAASVLMREAIAAAGCPIDWHVVDGDDVARWVESVRRTRVGVRGQVAPTAKHGLQSATVRFRKALGVHTIIRHARSLPGLPTPAKDVDVVVVREATEDIYAGFEHESAEGVYESVKVTTREACDRVARFAFEWAVAHGRKRVTTVHKANILKKADGMFLTTSREVAAAFPDVAHDDIIVDALCMKLVRNPAAFDVLVCGNLFGDIVSDCAAAMAGGPTVAGSHEIATGADVFGNPYAGFPDDASPDHANPFPMLGVGVDLLRHLGDDRAALRLRQACLGVLERGIRTPDLGGRATRDHIRDAVLAAL